MPTEDIGGGNKIVKIENPLEMAKGYLSLQQLGANLRKAPYELRQAAAEAALKEFEASPGMLEVKQFKAVADLHSAVGGEQRARAEFAQKSLSSLPATLGQNFELGKMHMKRLIEMGVLPEGTQVVKNQDGTFSMGAPQPTGEFQVTHLDPNRVGTVEARQGLEEKLRAGWEKVGTGFQTVDEFYRNFKANVNDATGPGDLTTLFSSLKMLDRTTQVGQGQSAEAQELIANMKTKITNLINAQQNSHNPVFGPANSITRQDFIQSMDKVYENSKQEAIRQARFFAESAGNGGANPRNVIQPYGGLGYDQAFGLAPFPKIPGTKGETPKTSEAPAAPKSDLSSDISDAIFRAKPEIDKPAPKESKKAGSEAALKVPGLEETPAPAPEPTVDPARAAAELRGTLPNLFNTQSPNGPEE